MFFMLSEMEALTREDKNWLKVSMPILTKGVEAMKV